MTPESFIEKWSANTRNERAAVQEHFIDLCRLLGEPTPNEADPDGVDYALEKGVLESESGRGFADVWRRGCFALEYKKKGSDLSAAFVQLQRYALALDNPPLLVVSDIDTIVIRTAWTNTVSETITVTLAEIANPLRRKVLINMFSEPERLRPAKTRQRLTEEAAGKIRRSGATLARPRAPGAGGGAFVNRIVFCLFADHASLLPAGLLQKLFVVAAKNPSRSEGYFRRLFDGLSRQGGEIDFTPLPWFNGELFEDDAALPLRAKDVRLLQAVRSLDWADIDVTIFGTLFERGLDPGKRSQLGAHYTNREKIDLIIDPVIVRPLRAEWAGARAAIEAALAGRAARAKTAQAIYQVFLDRLVALRVLDPACGSSNFLYMPMQALQDIEHLAGIEAEALGLQRAFARVGPEAVRGIEINPFAAELARVSVWIGHIQWARRNAVPPPSDPVLRNLDTIECRDAVLAPDGTPASWSLKMASRHGVGNDPTYNNQTCFETYPFPEHLTPNIPAAAYADNSHAQAIAMAARALVEARDRWLNPENLVDRVPDILLHLPHRIVPRNSEAALKLKSRTLTNLYNTRGKPEGAWLDVLHADLDAAVAAAYGWPADISEADALAALLALNLARSAGNEPRKRFAKRTGAKA